MKVASQAVPAGSGFLSAFGFGRPPPVPSKSDESEGDGHATEGTPEKKEKTEEDILREVRSVAHYCLSIGSHRELLTAGLGPTYNASLDKPQAT